MQAAIGGPDTFVRVALRQMSGILALVFVRKPLAPHVGEVGGCCLTFCWHLFAVCCLGLGTEVPQRM